MKYLIIFSILFYITTNLRAQSDEIRSSWNRARNLCNVDEYLKAKPLLLEVYSEMPRPLCCYWLALVYDIEEKRDSALFYYNKCIQNSSKPQLAALDNIIRLHLRKLDFDMAYNIAWQSVLKYPGNLVFLEELKEVCLWAYFIKHLGFNKHYLTSTKPHKGYHVKTITEQSLILKNIRNQNGQHLHIVKRSYRGYHENWLCRFNNSQEEIEIKFHLHDHNLDRQLELQNTHAKKVYNNKKEPIHIRLGALMTLTPFSDKELIDLLASDNEAIRLCTCSEVLINSSKKVKKTCRNDISENIKQMCAKLDAFQ
ncbi:MAG: hypothetical protein MK207_11515 [Saprospiraceae bacterium]|nr:hypothetical protein [Saprospiraceae bacterium]